MSPITRLNHPDHRKDVKQYLYTRVQEHAVWHNQQFWEASFYCDLQKGIKALYTADNPKSLKIAQIRPELQKVAQTKTSLTSQTTLTTLTSLNKPT